MKKWVRQRKTKKKESENQNKWMKILVNYKSTNKILNCCSSKLTQQTFGVAI